MIPASWLHAAAKIAILFWGAAWCGPVHQKIAQAIPAGDPPTTASWTYTPGRYYAKRLRCTIFYYGPDVRPWVWWRVCAATVHEWGHFTGHPDEYTDPSLPEYAVMHPIRQCPPQPRGVR